MIKNNNKDIKESGKESIENESRRRLLFTAAKLGTISGVLGLSSSLLFVDKAFAVDQTALQKLLDYAIKTGSIDAAIGVYGAEAELTSEQIDALKLLTPEELSDIETIREKLDSNDGDIFKTRRG